MKIDKFLTKYTGKKVDFDGAYGAQCVDLFRQYCKDVLNVPHTGAVEGAQDLWHKYDKLPLEQKYFERVDAGYVPYMGDVAIWAGTTNNKYGHVAIVIGYVGYSNGVLVFEQDGFTQKGAVFKICTFHGLLGFLRKKNG